MRLPRTTIEANGNRSVHPGEPHVSIYGSGGTGRGEGTGGGTGNDRSRLSTSNRGAICASQEKTSENFRKPAAANSHNPS